MLTEVKTAVGFLTHVLLQNVGRITLEKIDSFASVLEDRLCARYNGHWFPEWPAKGSGFRCIRINHQLDPLLAAVGKVCGIPNLGDLLPFELTIWIDPNEVSLRIGENGSVGVLYSSGGEEDQADSGDVVASSPAAAARPKAVREAPAPADMVDAQPRHHAVAPSSCAADVMHVSCKEQMRGVGRRPPAFNHFTAFVSS